MIIVPMLYEKIKSYDDVFLLRHRTCEIPRIFYHFLTIFHWDEYKDIDALAREIALWMDESTKTMENSIYDALFRLAAALERM